MHFIVVFFAYRLIYFPETAILVSECRFLAIGTPFLTLRNPPDSTKDGFDNTIPRFTQ